MTTVRSASRRPTLAADVAALVRERIWDGRLRAGDRIPQDEIASELGVSRIPVREALIALERDGLVRIEANRGVFVTGLDAQILEDYFTMFGVLYGLAVELATQRIDDSGLDELDRRRRELRALDDAAADAGSALVVTQAFNRVVMGAVGSPQLRAALASMASIVPGSYFETIPGAIPVAVKGLDAVYRAMRRRDADEAQRQCRVMMRRHGALTVAEFERRAS